MLEPGKRLQMGENGRADYLERLSLRVEGRLLESVFARALAES